MLHASYFLSLLLTFSGSTAQMHREVLIHDLAVLHCAASDCSREKGRAACTEGELIVGGLKE